MGDCDGNGTLAINELIVGVNLALGSASQSQCPSFDADGGGTVTISELIAAVNNALNRCPPDTSGVLLQGPAGMLAVDATVEMPPVAVDEGEIEDGVIMTRLDLHLTPGATVGQVNAALALVHGGVVSMLRGHPTLTIAIPRPADLDGLADVVQTLRGASGINWTAIERVADPTALPPSPAGDNLSQLSHLLPTRFPAAWNAAHLATKDCAARKVRVLVADFFQRPPLTGPYADFLDEIHNFTLFGDTGPRPRDETHGYDVTTTLAGLFNAANPTGANPFSDCLAVDGIQLDGLSAAQKFQRIALSMPAGKFLLNCSFGFHNELTPTLIDQCAMNGCTADQVEQEIALPLTRAYHGAEWIRLTSGRWDDFLVSKSAGNDRDEPSAAIYRGLGIAAFDQGITVATLLPQVAFLSDVSSWNPSAAFPRFPDLTASSADIGAFELYMQALGVDTAGPADNVLIAGSTTTGATVDALVESDFSEENPDLFAVGEHVFTFGGFTQGTSFAAPQVAGLASYLWLLSPDLQSRPVSATRHAILANLDGFGVIDAYATALSLDAAALPSPATAPVRLAILDVDHDGNGDGDFDAADLVEFIDRYVDSQTGQPFEPTEPDYSRFDLNGDGKTGGSGTGRFDLDRVGSTQYGASQYSRITQQIEVGPVSFDETHLTDLEVLCYYAYSPLYAQDAQNTQLRTSLFTLTPGCMVPVVLEAVFPTTIAPETDTLLVVRVLNELSDGTRKPIPDVRIELTPSGGTVDDFAGVTDTEGFFQTRARLSSGSQQITIGITARGQAGGQVVAQRTVQASVGPQILRGQLSYSLDCIGAEGTSTNEIHRILSASVTAELRANGTIAIVEATGSFTGGEVAAFDCFPHPNDPNPVPVRVSKSETTHGTITGGEYASSGTMEGLLIFSGSWTIEHKDVNDKCMVLDLGDEHFEGVGAAGLQGTPVVQAARLVAIDFNSSESGNCGFVQSGRLELQP